jgi:hypothetical protein
MFTRKAKKMGHGGEVGHTPDFSNGIHKENTDEGDKDRKRGISRMGAIVRENDPAYNFLAKTIPKSNIKDRAAMPKGYPDHFDDGGEVEEGSIAPMSRVTVGEDGIKVMRDGERDYTGNPGEQELGDSDMSLFQRNTNAITRNLEREQDADTEAAARPPLPKYGERAEEDLPSSVKMAHGGDVVSKVMGKRMAAGGKVEPMPTPTPEPTPDPTRERIQKNLDMTYSPEQIQQAIKYLDAKKMSRGGMVANEDEPIADSESADFDVLNKEDDLDFSYTGKNSGDEEGDVISKIMKRRAR